MDASAREAVGRTENAAYTGRRERVLEAVSQVLAQQKRNATEILAAVEDCSVPLAEVIAEFPDFDDLVVAIAAREAERVSGPLRSAVQADAFDDVRSELIEFGTGLRATYSSVLIGFLRAAITEGTRRKNLNKSIFEQGPNAVCSALRDYLEAAARKGKLEFVNSGYAAESLIGMLREPLQQELLVHSHAITSYKSAEEAVEQAVDRFLGGCAVQEEVAA